MRLDSCHKLRCGKRLGDIIIRSQPESADLINILLFSRNHDNRDILMLPDLLTDIKSIRSRQHKVQDNKVIWSGKRSFQSLCTIRLKIYFKSGKLQIILFQLRYRFLILHNQDLFLVLIHSFCPLSAAQMQIRHHKAFQTF